MCGFTFKRSSIWGRKAAPVRINWLLLHKVSLKHTQKLSTQSLQLEMTLHIIPHDSESHAKQTTSHLTSERSPEFWKAGITPFSLPTSLFIHSTIEAPTQNPSPFFPSCFIACTISKIHYLEFGKINLLIFVHPLHFSLGKEQAACNNAGSSVWELTFNSF